MTLTRGRSEGLFGLIALTPLERLFGITFADTALGLR